MKILAIDTSCDDTAIAILNVKGKKKPVLEVLVSIVSSQIEIHRKWGGVHPSLAKREHQKNLIPVLKKCLEKTKLLEKMRVKRPMHQNKFGAWQEKDKNLKLKSLKEILTREEHLFKSFKKFLLRYKKPKIDLIGITVGPGLEPCLWTGVNFAKALAHLWNLPIVPINHIEAHIAANFINRNHEFQILNSKIFPALCLIVSGGHTQLILMKDFGKYKILGETRDDAAGECFDKTARILGLSYPGGPAIAAEAKKLKISDIKHKIKLPRPMFFSKDYDFSFSGLKTAVLYDFKKRRLKTKKSKQYIKEMAAEIEQSIVDVLIKKTMKAAKDLRVKTIILGGGVVANKELRRQLAKKIKKETPNIKYYIPDIKYCTDNAAMIAISTYFNWKKRGRKSWQKIRADANLRVN